MNRGVELPAGVIDAAIAWAVRVDYGEPSDETRRAFTAWLNADERHAQAWRHLTALKAPFSTVAAQHGAVAGQALDGARARQARRRALKLLAFSGA
ncbi:FecR/PupR family sigma factor regulator, partial [Achromobacter xylosoxidans]|uniref:FecR/PupR family sigma factor regulator n=1 Tax=Alcaligenes xylosoxydans xylosoxydans TaxID=85698 RepID=UPI00055565F5